MVADLCELLGEVITEAGGPLPDRSAVVEVVGRTPELLAEVHAHVTLGAGRVRRVGPPAGGAVDAELAAALISAALDYNLTHGASLPGGANLPGGPAGASLGQRLRATVAAMLDLAR